MNSSMTPNVLNGKSLTALVLANRDRPLFFQDHSDAIRRVTYAASASQWTVDSTPITYSIAKHLTPIVRSVLKQPESSEQVFLCI